MARPFKANIQVRVCLHILDFGHVVLTRGSIWLFIDSTKITIRRSLVGTVSFEVEIGRASCRERVLNMYASILAIVVAGT